MIILSESFEYSFEMNLSKKLNFFSLSDTFFIPFSKNGCIFFLYSVFKLLYCWYIVSLSFSSISEIIFTYIFETVVTTVVPSTIMDSVFLLMGICKSVVPIAESFCSQSSWRGNEVSKTNLHVTKNLMQRKQNHFTVFR